MVMGCAGRGMETRSCPVQIDRRVPTHHPMTALKWKHLRNGNEREFGINMALAQMNDPKFHGEINCYRGLSDLHDTLEKLMRDAQGRVMEVMKELVVVDGQLDLCKKRLEISNAYEELDRYFRQAMPIPLRPRRSPIQSPLRKHQESLGLLCHSLHVLGELWRCLSSIAMTRTATGLSSALGARRWDT